jgi:hypothetical protein
MAPAVGYLAKGIGAGWPQQWDTCERDRAGWTQQWVTWRKGQGGLAPAASYLAKGTWRDGPSSGLPGERDRGGLAPAVGYLTKGIGAVWPQQWVT